MIQPATPTKKCGGRKMAHTMPIPNATANKATVLGVEFIVAPPIWYIWGLSHLVTVYVERRRYVNEIEGKCEICLITYSVKSETVLSWQENVGRAACSRRAQVVFITMQNGYTNDSFISSSTNPCMRGQSGRTKSPRRPKTALSFHKEDSPLPPFSKKVPPQWRRFFCKTSIANEYKNCKSFM